MVENFLEIFCFLKMSITLVFEELCSDDSSWPQTWFYWRRNIHQKAFKMRSTYSTMEFIVVIKKFNDIGPWSLSVSFCLHLSLYFSV